MAGEEVFVQGQRVHVRRTGLDAGVEVHRRNALAHEGVLVRAHEHHFLGLRVGGEADAQHVGGGLDVVFQAGVFDADRHHVGDVGQEHRHVHVDVRHQRAFDARVGREVFGAEQAAFFGGERHEQQRALGRRRRHQFRRGFQHHRRAQGVVEGAVVDAVTVHFGADADVVEMSRVDDVLGRQRGVGAGQPADDVVAGDLRQGGAAGQRGLAFKVEGFQRAGLAAREDFVGVHRRTFEQAARGMHAQAGGRAQLREGVHRLAVRAKQAHAGHRPVAGAAGPGVFGLVHRVADLHRADGAAFGQGDQLLPARGVEGALGVGEVGRGAGKVHGDLAAHVHAFEVVVVQLGCVHRLADEHQRRGDRVAGGVVVHARQEVVLEGEFDAFAAAADAEAGAFGFAPAFEQRHRLQVAAVVAGRFQADGAVAVGHVQRGQVVTAGAGGAAFKQVVGQESDVGFDAPGTVGFARGGRRRGPLDFGGRFAAAGHQQGQGDRNQQLLHSGHSQGQSPDATTGPGCWE